MQVFSFTHTHVIEVSLKSLSTDALHYSNLSLMQRFMYWFGIRWRTQRNVIHIVNCTIPRIYRHLNASCIVRMYLNVCLCQWQSSLWWQHIVRACQVVCPDQANSFLTDMWKRLTGCWHLCADCDSILSTYIQMYCKIIAWTSWHCIIDKNMDIH